MSLRVKVYPTSSVHLWCRDQDSKNDGNKDRGIQFHIMEDREQLSEAMERLEKSIDKEVAKLKYYMEPADELIENSDYLEMEIALKQGTQIIDKITDLISQLEGMTSNGTLEFLRAMFDSGKRTKRTSILPLYRKTKFTRYCQGKKEKETMRSKGRIGSPNGTARSA